MCGPRGPPKFPLEGKLFCCGEPVETGTSVKRREPTGRGVSGERRGVSKTASPEKEPPESPPSPLRKHERAQTTSPPAKRKMPPGYQRVRPSSPLQLVAWYAVVVACALGMAAEASRAFVGSVAPYPVASHPHYRLKNVWDEGARQRLMDVAYNTTFATVKADITARITHLGEGGPLTPEGCSHRLLIANPARDECTHRIMHTPSHEPRRAPSLACCGNRK